MGIFSNYLDNPTDAKIRFVFSIAAVGIAGCIGIGYGENRYLNSVTDAQITSHPDYRKTTEDCLRNQVMVHLYDDRKNLADSLIAGKTISASDAGLTEGFYQKAKADCHAAAKPVITKTIADNDFRYAGLELAKIPALLLILGGLLGGIVGLGTQYQDGIKKTPKP